MTDALLAAATAPLPTIAPPPRTAPGQQPPVAPTPQERGRRLLFGGYLALIFCAALWLFTLNNDFSIRFHPDEPSKVRQIMDGQWNFKHPQLLLTTTRAAAAVAGSEDRQDLVEIGRFVSAAFGAGAIVLLATLVYVMHGTFAGMVAAFFLLLSPPLVSFSHFMKEDTALLLGLAAAALALAFYYRRPSRSTLIALGLAAGLAVSGKYIGVLMLLLVAVLVHRWPHTPLIRQRLERTGLVVGLAIAAVLAINYLAVFHPHRLIHGLGYEAVHVATGHGGIQTSRLSPMYLQSILALTTLPLLVLALANIAYTLMRWNRQSAMQRIQVLFPIGFLLVLHLSSVQFMRYLLPVVVWMSILAAGSLAAIVVRLPLRPRLRYGLGILAALILITPSALEVRRISHEIADDSREHLRAWVEQNLRPGERLLQDQFCGLPFGGTRIGDIVTERFAMSLGSPEELAAQGITYVAVCELTYGRFFDPWSHPADEEQHRYHALKARYEQLFASTTPAWTRASPGRRIGYINPAVTVYRLNPVSEAIPARGE